jgi:hypothetical protein
MDTITLSTTRISITTLIAMLIATITFTLIATILTTSLRQHALGIRDDQSTKFRVCLIGLPNCLSVYEPPAPCSLSSMERCPVGGEFGLVDPALR